MTPEQIKKLRTKSKDELIRIVVELDKKLFRIIKDLFRDSDRDDRSLNDFFAETIDYNDKLEEKDNKPDNQASQY